MRKPSPSTPDQPRANTLTDVAPQNSPRGSGFGDSVARPVASEDLAAYMADILLELREMARQGGFETLERVLEIAEREAKQRAVPRAS